MIPVMRTPTAFIGAVRARERPGELRPRLRHRERDPRTSSIHQLLPSRWRSAPRIQQQDHHPTRDVYSLDTASSSLCSASERTIAIAGRGSRTAGEHGRNRRHWSQCGSRSWSKSFADAEQRKHERSSVDVFATAGAGERWNGEWTVVLETRYGTWSE